ALCSTSALLLPIPLITMANYCSGESVCSSLSWDQPIAPLFYSPEYERELMERYLPDSPSSPSSSSADSLELRVPDEQPIEEEEYYEEEGVNYMDVPYESSDYSPTPSPQPVPKKPVVRQTRAKVAPSQIQMQSQGVRKRGRPAGSKSNSKMAQYSKQYREAKKNEAAALNDQIDALARDNDRLAEDNDRLKREVELLRRADSISTKLATLLETHRRNPGVFRLCVDTNGTPFLEVI
ncbi:hypothetical protein PMAYCL1PPCAC_11581, partial [Pristionchus mayeri]